MFQKNIEVLKFKNPKLAAKIESLSLEDVSENFSVFEAESKDLIIAYKDIPLNSPADPIQESRQIWTKSIKAEPVKNDIHLVFGIGLGYLFKRTYVSSPAKVFVFEPNIEILRYVFEYIDFSQELADKRVYFTDNFDTLIEKIQNEYLAGDKIEPLFVDTYALLNQKILMNLTTEIIKICQLKNMDQNTIFSQCKDWTINNITNMKFFPKARPVSILQDKFKEKPALIVCSGPSLKENLKNIKENKDKYILICIGNALKYLIQKDITPDFAVFSDSKHLEQHIEGIEDKLKDINLITCSKADFNLSRNPFKRKLFYLSKTDAIADWLNSVSSQHFKLYKSAGSVSIISYFIAKEMGCAPIVYAGLDLSFVDNKLYADGKELDVNSEGDINLGYAPSYNCKKAVQVKGRNGKNILSRDDYALFIRQFEDIIEEENIQNQIISTSLNGANIKGMKYQDFNKINNEISSENINVDEILTQLFEQSTQDWDNVLNNLAKNLIKEHQKIKLINDNCKKIVDTLGQINKHLQGNNVQITFVESLAKDIQENMSKTRGDIISNIFLSNSLQKEILDYTNNYKLDVLPSIEIIKHNMQTEYNLFNIADMTSSAIEKNLNGVILKYKRKVIKDECVV